MSQSSTHPCVLKHPLPFYSQGGSKTSDWLRRASHAVSGSCPIPLRGVDMPAEDEWEEKKVCRDASEWWKSRAEVLYGSQLQASPANPNEDDIANADAKASKTLAATHQAVAKCIEDGSDEEAEQMRSTGELKRKKNWTYEDWDRGDEAWKKSGQHAEDVNEVFEYLKAEGKETQKESVTKMQNAFNAMAGGHHTKATARAYAAALTPACHVCGNDLMGSDVCDTLENVDGEARWRNGADVASKIHSSKRRRTHAQPAHTNLSITPVGRA